MSFGGFGSSRFRITRGDSHPSHGPLNALAVDDEAPIFKLIDYSAAAQKRPRQMDLIDSPHDA